MTPGERQTPKIINGSRRARIARGSGATVTDVNQLLERFTAAQKMMRQMAKGGGMPPGMGNLPGMGGNKKSRGRGKAAKRTKARSGNPAKRAEQERQAAERRASEAPSAPAGSAFGLGTPPKGNDGGPPDLSGFLGR
jgi:signal recognition particle subunit SRP54